MSTTITHCRHCGKSHGVRCPEVKALEYFESGDLKRVEFVTPADYLAPVISSTFIPPSPLQPFGEWLPNPFPPNSQSANYGSPGGFKRAVDCEVSDK